MDNNEKMTKTDWRKMTMKMKFVVMTMTFNAISICVEKKIESNDDINNNTNNERYEIMTRKRNIINDSIIFCENR